MLMTPRPIGAAPQRPDVAARVMPLESAIAALKHAQVAKTHAEIDAWLQAADAMIAEARRKATA